MELDSGGGRGDTYDTSDDQHQGRSTVHGKSPSFRIVQVSGGSEVVRHRDPFLSIMSEFGLIEPPPFDPQAISHPRQAPPPPTPRNQPPPPSPPPTPHLSHPP